MGFLDFANHVLNFFYPAAAMALLMSAMALLIRCPKPLVRRFWACVAIQFAANSTVLVAGLLIFGNDGKMATYAALVVVSATVAWVIRGGLRA